MPKKFYLCIFNHLDLYLICNRLPITGGGGGGGAWGGTPLLTTLVVAIGVLPLFVVFRVLELPKLVSIKKQDMLIKILFSFNFYYTAETD